MRRTMVALDEARSGMLMLTRGTAKEKLAGFLFEMRDRAPSRIWKAATTGKLILWNERLHVERATGPPVAGVAVTRINVGQFVDRDLVTTRATPSSAPDRPPSNSRELLHRHLNSSDEPIRAQT